MTPKQTYYSQTAHKAIQALKKRNMDGRYYETKEEALAKVLEMIPENSLVSWGGSQSLIETGILASLRAGNYRLLDRDAATTPEELGQCFRDAFSADYYLMSSNAITMDGKLINIDGTCNRLAALLYGPKNVIIVAGMNKIVLDEESGILRARNVAAPMNAMRLQCSTPCASRGLCYNCTEEECLCAQMVITRMSKIKNRIRLVLVGEELGF